MGVPGFYSWLTRRYPMIKHMIDKQSLPQIDYLYLDMNGIIYKCVRDDSVIFKAQLMPKELEEIWIQIFNYINQLVDMLKPTKMVVLALDGVAPRCKMNNQRARRYRSAQQYKQFIQRLTGYTGNIQSEQNFKNNSISPGTAFMNQLNQMLHFFIQKKMQQDDYWKSLSVIFTGSDTPGEGEHKIMEFVRGNKHQFKQSDNHCFYGADADLIMLGLTLPIKNSCIIREEYVHMSDKVHIMSSRRQKEINFELIFINILKQCMDLEYSALKDQMKIGYDIDQIARDFVFLFFFVGNDFLPRIYAYNIRQKSIQDLIYAFKQFLQQADAYITAGSELNMTQLLRLLEEISKYQSSFYQDKSFEFDKVLKREQRNFEDELQKKFLENIYHEKQTLQGLRQMYTNLDSQGRSFYYQTYFQLDPQQHVDGMWNALAYYVYGLKFVFEYYFVNLASWSWYYPYYFAPLLMDITFYLRTQISRGQKFVDFEKGQPFEPFKQLLCILPKQSAELLPKNFQPYLLQSDSKMRQPVDFYPDTIQTISYGSVKGYQAVSLIPFIDQSVVTEIYNQQIQKTAPQDLPRNINRACRLYQYGQTEHRVDSPFATIDSFMSRASIREVNLLQPFQWRSRHYLDQVNEGEEHLLKIPTLYMKKFISQPMKQKKSSSYFELRLVYQPAREQFKLGQNIFYGYPMEHSGRIEGFLTKKTFICGNQFEAEDYHQFLKETKIRTAEDIRDNPSGVFNQLKNYGKGIKGSLFQYIDFSESEVFLFVADTQTFSRNLEGDFTPLYINNNKRSYTIVPGSLASFNKVYQTTRTHFRFKTITEQFRIDEEVLLCHPDKQLCGARGKVVGYTENGLKVKVQVQKEPKYSQQTINDIIQILSTKADVFFSLRFAAELVQSKFDHLLSILQSINVAMPRDSKLPASIDIGLNFMNRRQYAIVPNLVRINFKEQREKKKDNPFKYLEFSYQALQIIIQYKRKFPEIFAFMEQRHYDLIEQSRENPGSKIDWGRQIYAKDIYPQNTDKMLMAVYKWLIEKEQTHMPASSVNSKQVQLRRIHKLQQEFVLEKGRRLKIQSTKGSKSKQKYQQKNKVVIVDPNFLFSHRLSKLGTLYLQKRPLNHQIGDLVVCINPKFFGHYGAIIGIDKNQYQVLFDEPSFGKSELGGICDNLWGAKLQFRDLLNLQIWPRYFSERVKGASLSQKRGWISSLQEFYPCYNYKPFQDFEDIKAFTAKEENKAYFSKQFLERVEDIQKNLKQVHVDRDYHVVDNKKQEHRYKYDKKIQYIEKEQVDEAVKMAKIMQQPQSFQHQQPQQEHKPAVVEEIIQNRVQEQTKAEELGDQEDADDILS